jgi:hypothetical protein
MRTVKNLVLPQFSTEASGVPEAKVNDFSSLWPACGLRSASR